MDVTDQRILESLKQNSRMTASDIGKRVGLSVPAVSERIRKLEEAGVIEAYTVKINRGKPATSYSPSCLSALSIPSI